MGGVLGGIGGLLTYALVAPEEQDDALLSATTGAGVALGLTAAAVATADIAGEQLASASASNGSSTIPVHAFPSFSARPGGGLLSVIGAF